MVHVALTVSSCKKNVVQKSKLAVYGGEDQFSQAVCNKKISVARFSQVKIGSKTIAMLSPDYCVNRSKSKYSAQNKGEFALAGVRSSVPAPKPVFVHYGYAGNSSHDSVVRDGGAQIIDWARGAGYRVLNVSGMDLGEAQRVIADDRRSHPRDYEGGGHVTFNVDAHGGTDENGIHRIYSSSESSNSRVNSNLRTTDVLSAFVNSAGSRVGTIVCNVQSCEGSDTISDPNFENLRQNSGNPDQMRVFHFGGGPGTPAQTPWDGAVSGEQRSKIEQSTLLMLQNANPERGLTVGGFQEIQDDKDLRLLRPEVTSYFVPTAPGAISDTGNPLGTESHRELKYFDEGAQSPTLVGPSEAYLIPPGVAPIQGFKPVLGKDGINSEIQTMPSQVSGGFIHNDGLQPSNDRKSDLEP
jgi:hypothetical protein